ncbi:MAG: hypothetical protein HY606_06225 [Planctomycetes bacterium]|nr:hypothetical protein [Planctomycetota bacterium]
MSKGFRFMKEQYRVLAFPLIIVALFWIIFFYFKFRSGDNSDNQDKQTQYDYKLKDQRDSIQKSGRVSEAQNKPEVIQCVDQKRSVSCAGTLKDANGIPIRNAWIYIGIKVLPCVCLNVNNSVNNSHRESLYKTQTNENGNYSITIDYSSHDTQQAELSLIAGTFSNLKEYCRTAIKDVPQGSLGGWEHTDTPGPRYKGLVYSQKYIYVLSKQDDSIKADLTVITPAIIDLKLLSDPMVPRAYAYLEIPDLFVPSGLQLDSSNDSFCIQYAKLLMEAPIGIAFDMIIVAEGFPDQRVRVESLVSGQIKQITVKMERGGIKFHGKCVDENGSPVKSVKVSVSQDGLCSISAFSGGDGVFILDGLLNKPIKQFLAFPPGIKHSRYHHIELNDISLEEIRTVVLKQIN